MQRLLVQGDAGRGKKMKGVSLLIAVVLLITVTACDKINPEKKEAARQKTVVVLCDLSESTKNMRNIYPESFKEIISSIGHGDAIYVVKITESSIEEPEIPIKEVFPEFIPKDKFGNPTDNP